MTLFGMSRHDWGNLHLYLSFFLIALTLAHLILNYAFIKNAIAGGRRTTVVLLALVGIILISVLLLWPVEQRDTAEHHGRGNRNQRESTQRFR